MCFHFKQSKQALELKTRFNAKIDKIESFKSSDHYNAFTFPKTPVITNGNPELIDNLQWGLIPKWAKDDNIKKYTLNARIETITEKPSFRGSVNNRCLVIVDGYYEWQWLDSKGKNKQKYLISLPNDELFSFAGLWENWVNKQTGETCKTYTIITTDANEQIAEIHNSKKRMPVVLTPEHETNWLNNDKIMNFKDVYIEFETKKLN